MSTDDTFRSVRKEYERGSLDESSVDADPLAQFQVWLAEALKAPEVEPNACALATVSQDGKPSLRMVLLKSLDDRGFSFFSNYHSRKGRELAQNAAAAILFYWGSLERQVRIEGTVERLSAAESDAYFASRPRNAQLGAIVSPQSEVAASRQAIEERYAQLAASVGDSALLRPTHWGGYRIIPESMEFWQGRESRLHDRIRYERDAGLGWKIGRLWP